MWYMRSFLWVSYMPVFNWLAVPFSFNLAIELWMKNGLSFTWLFLSWRIVDLRCINYCCTAKWLRCMYYIHYFSYSFHSGLSQAAEYSFLGCTVGLLVYPFYLYQCAFADPELPIHPFRPLPCSLPGLSSYSSLFSMSVILFS